MGMSTQGAESDSTTVFRISSHGKLKDIGRMFNTERFRFDGGHYAVTGPVPFGRSGSFAVSGASWFYTDGSRFEIQQRAPSGRITALISMQRSREPVTPEAVHRFGAARLVRADPVLRRDDSLALAWMRFPTTKPAYTALKIDAARNLWARLWANDDEPATWDVFAPNGHFLGVIGVPPDLDVIEVGNDYLLARYTRVFGVEEVRVYRITRGG